MMKISEKRLTVLRGLVIAPDQEHLAQVHNPTTYRQTGESAARSCQISYRSRRDIRSAQSGLSVLVWIAFARTQFGLNRI
jgi:hypothetical protein